MLSKHFEDLKLDNYAQKADHICVVETWLHPNTFDSDFPMAGRSLDHSSYGRGKGVGIFSEYLKQNCCTAKIAKEDFQMISIIDSNQSQLIVVYLSSNCNLINLVQELQGVIRSDLVTIITGDFNFCKDDKNVLTKFLSKENFEQIVTSPTHDEGRTLDHCYVPSSIKGKIELTTYSPYYSDHDALCITLKL